MLFFVMLHSTLATTTKTKKQLHVDIWSLVFQNNNVKDNMYIDFKAVFYCNLLYKQCNTMSSSRHIILDLHVLGGKDNWHEMCSECNENSFYLCLALAMFWTGIYAILQVASTTEDLQVSEIFRIHTMFWSATSHRSLASDIYI